MLLRSCVFAMTSLLLVSLALPAFADPHRTANPADTKADSSTLAEFLVKHPVDGTYPDAIVFGKSTFG